MPTQDRIRGHQQLKITQAGAGGALQQSGQHSAVDAIQPWSRVLAVQHCELVAQHQDLRVLIGAATPEQAQRREELDQTEVDKPQRNCSGGCRFGEPGVSVGELA